MSETDRRAFLKRALLLLLSLAALAAGLWRTLSERGRSLAGAGSRGASSRSEESIAGEPAVQVEAALRREFDYLEVEAGAYERYAREFLADRRRRWRPGQVLPQRDRVRFLMSTDFFQNGADEARPLRYIAYYQPYVSPCYNPVARLVDGDEVQG